jgi:hypothetical protein
VFLEVVFSKYVHVFRINLNDPMKKAKMTLIILLAIGLFSCKSIGEMIAQKNGDFVQPQKESMESILSYCNDKKVNYDRSYVVISESQFASFIEKYKEIPAIFVFDKSNHLITTAEKTACSWAMLNMFNDTISETISSSDTSKFSEIMSHFILIDDRQNDKEADYYILCTWAKFFPKLSNQLFETINKQKEEKELNVCHILLNVDLQESWGAQQ